MTADWEPDAAQEGVVVEGPREGIEVPADGTTVELTEWPGDGTTPLHITEAAGGVPYEDRDRLNADAIGAIRLAIAAGADQDSQLKLIHRLLTYAPETDGRATGPTMMLVQAITDEQARVSVPAAF